MRTFNLNFSHNPSMLLDSVTPTTSHPVALSVISDIVAQNAVSYSILKIPLNNIDTGKKE